jgi:hypothetical protein
MATLPVRALFPDPFLSLPEATQRDFAGYLMRQATKPLNTVPVNDRARGADNGKPQPASARQPWSGNSRSVSSSGPPPTRVRVLEGGTKPSVTGSGSNTSANSLNSSTTTIGTTISLAEPNQAVPQVDLDAPLKELQRQWEAIKARTAAKKVELFQMRKANHAEEGQFIQRTVETNVLRNAMVKDHQREMEVLSVKEAEASAQLANHQQKASESLAEVQVVQQRNIEAAAKLASAKDELAAELAEEKALQERCQVSSSRKQEFSDKYVGSRERIRILEEKKRKQEESKDAIQAELNAKEESLRAAMEVFAEKQNVVNRLQRRIEELEKTRR